MKLDQVKLASMSDAELEALNQDLTAQRDAIRAEQLLIKTELDDRAVKAQAAARAAAMSPAERAALQRAIG